MITNGVKDEVYRKGFKDRYMKVAIETATKNRQVFKWIDILPGDIPDQSKHNRDVIIR